MSTASGQLDLPGLPGMLAAGAERVLRDSNPWWRHEKLFGVPLVRRWAFEPTLKGLRRGLAPVTVLRGPRQVGKTTLLNQIVETLLSDGIAPKRIFRVQFDDIPQLARLKTPILDLVAWYADWILGCSINAYAHEQQGPVHLLLDEVQNLPDWATQVKHLVDLQPVRAVVTGSSALRIEPYLPFNGLAPLKNKEFWVGLRMFGERHRVLRDRSFSMFSERGAYPLAHMRADATWDEISALLIETVVRRAIQHDLRVGERGRRRDEALLEEVFRLSCRYIGQSPSQALYLDEAKRALNANIGWQRIPVEVKYRRRIDHADTRGLRSFIEKAACNAPFGILVTQLDNPGSEDPRIVSLPLSSLLLMR
jgi:predicted AAA+ superfamily ATPase